MRQLGWLATELARPAMILGSVGKKQIVFSQLDPDRDREAPLPPHKTEEILTQWGKGAPETPVSQATWKGDSGHRCCASGQAGPGAWSAHGALTGRSVHSRQTPPRPHAVIALSVLSLHCSLWARAARPCPAGQHKPGSHLPPGCSLRSSLPCATSQSPHRLQAWLPRVTPQTQPRKPHPFSGLRVNRAASWVHPQRRTL